MNNSNDPTNDPVNSTPTQPSFPPAPTSMAAATPAKRSFDWRKISIAAAAVVVVIALVAGAYMLGQKNGETKTANTAATSDTSSASDTKLAEEVEEKTTDKPVDAYASWMTYTHPTFGYSFKHPADWSVNREVMQDPADWVTINPAGKTDTNSPAALSIYTYFDGTGCPETTTKEFMIGTYTVEGTACTGTEVYKISMKHSAVASAGNHGVILARAAPDLVGIQVDMSRGENDTLKLILESVTGLTPYSN